MVALLTAIWMDAEKAEDMFADVLAMRPVIPALTAVRAYKFGNRSCGQRPSDRPKRPEPPPTVPRKAEIKVAAECTPKVSDTNQPPEYMMRQVDAFLSPTTLRATVWTSRHPARSPYTLLGGTPFRSKADHAKARPPFGACQAS